jgi:hypothetical protein
MKFPKMRSFAKTLCFLCALSVSAASFGLEREAFSISNYDLNLQIDRQQHRLGVRGKITLRNDSAAAQKIAVLQISSSLAWRSIRVADKALQYVTQPYTSDIDHTGSLSEAIVTLPDAVAPHGSIDLDIAYEGVIVVDATRLTRIGTPDDLAKSTDWDQIDTNFSAVRGAGYVAWYPMATEVANLSEGDSLFEVLARWKLREAGSNLHVKISMTQESGEETPEVLLNHPNCFFMREQISRAQELSSDCKYQPLGATAPALVIGKYSVLSGAAVEVHFLRGHDVSAGEYADAAAKVLPLITDWFGPQREKPKVADLPDPDAAPFESGAFLLTPLGGTELKLGGLSAAHQLTHASFQSFRPWIEEGLAHFAQALTIEQQKGRQSALDYMGLHRTALNQVEQPGTAPRSEDEGSRSLVNTVNEELYRSKAMCVWWMVRDMVGDAALKKALAAYRPEQDKDPSYMQHLISAQTQRDLEWFFDDWVYRDRGLPDFKVESAFSRKTLTESFLLTVTVDNLGTAGAEVPVIVKFKDGAVTKRLVVRAKDKASVRIETPSAPLEVVVNDGSVPESDVTNNSLKVEAAKD